MDQNKIKNIIFNLVTGKIEKYEPLFIVLIFAVLLLNMLDSKVVEAITFLVLSSIALLYIMTAFKDVSGADFTENDTFFLKIGAFSSAMALIGIQFSLMGFPGNKMMLVVGAASLIAVVIYILIKGQVKKFGEWTVLRMAVLMVIAGGFIWGWRFKV
jgi:hypothetical protein